MAKGDEEGKRDEGIKDDKRRKRKQIEKVSRENGLIKTEIKDVQ